MRRPLLRAPGRRTFGRLRRMLGQREVSRRRIERYLERMRGVMTSQLSMASRDSVAIVVPCFGHAAHLPKMFESVVRQTRPPEEVVFVVDGANDDTETQLARLIEQQNETLRTRYSLLVNARNQGQAASLNRGIASSTHDLILILNDDDYLMHDTVEVMLSLFAGSPEIALIGGHSVHFGSDDELASMPKMISAYSASALPPLVVRRPADVLRYRTYNDLNMTHTGSCFMRGAWEIVGGYYPDKRQRLVPFSDRDFQLRVNALFSVAVSPEIPLSFWRRGSSVDHGLNS
jgi:glycosyltransferase involved in cell wall biosynthesis